LVDSEKVDPPKNPVDEVDENLVRNAFATLVLFEDLEAKFVLALEKCTDRNELPDDIDAQLVKAYEEACRMRAWRRNTKSEIEITLKKKLTEEFKKEY